MEMTKLQRLIKTVNVTQCYSILKDNLDNLLLNLGRT